MKDQNKTPRSLIKCLMYTKTRWRTIGISKGECKEEQKGSAQSSAASANWWGEGRGGSRAKGGSALRGEGKGETCSAGAEARPGPQSRTSGGRPLDGRSGLGGNTLTGAAPLVQSLRRCSSFGCSLGGRPLSSGFGLVSPTTRFARPASTVRDGIGHPELHDSQFRLLSELSEERLAYHDCRASHVQHYSPHTQLSCFGKRIGEDFLCRKEGGTL